MEYKQRFNVAVVIHSVKLKILKANHNTSMENRFKSLVVIHSVKLKILKANHNGRQH